VVTYVNTTAKNTTEKRRNRIPPPKPQRLTVDLIFSDAYTTTTAAKTQ